MTRLASNPFLKLGALIGRASGLAVCVAVLGTGCISEMAYDAKVTELERLRSESRERDARYLERIDRLALRLGELERQSAQAEQRLGEAVRTLVQVQDAVARTGAAPVTTRPVSHQPKPKTDWTLAPVF